MADPARAMLRHTVATLAYRTAKALQNAPPGFADARAHPSTRTAAETLAHMGDLLDWALTMARGAERWNAEKPLPWDAEVARFFAALQALDAYLESDAPLHATVERLFQGAVADALTHTGQLGVLRRIAGAPVRGENYSIADIAAGRVREDQPDAKYEFD